VPGSARASAYTDQAPRPIAARPVAIASAASVGHPGRRARRSSTGGSRVGSVGAASTGGRAAGSDGAASTSSVHRVSAGQDGLHRLVPGHTEDRAEGGRRAARRDAFSARPRRGDSGGFRSWKSARAETKGVPPEPPHEEGRLRRRRRRLRDPARSRGQGDSPAGLLRARRRWCPPEPASRARGRQLRRRGDAFGMCPAGQGSAGFRSWRSASAQGRGCPPEPA
jgi:hypothetical protein